MPCGLGTQWQELRFEFQMNTGPFHTAQESGGFLRGVVLEEVLLLAEFTDTRQKIPAVHCPRKQGAHWARIHIAVCGLLPTKPSAETRAGEPNRKQVSYHICSRRAGWGAESYPWSKLACASRAKAHRHSLTISQLSNLTTLPGSHLLT